MMLKLTLLTHFNTNTGTIVRSLGSVLRACVLNPLRSVVESAQLPMLRARLAQGLLFTAACR